MLEFLFTGARAVVHKETVVACLRFVADGKLTTEVRTYQTITSDLLRMAEWLAANECTHVAMEATGVYWKPVWHILDDGEFALVLANAAHARRSHRWGCEVGKARRELMHKAGWSAITSNASASPKP